MVTEAARADVLELVRAGLGRAFQVVVVPADIRPCGRLVCRDLRDGLVVSSSQVVWLQWERTATHGGLLLSEAFTLSGRDLDGGDLIISQVLHTSGEGWWVHVKRRGTHNALETLDLPFELFDLDSKSRHRINNLVPSSDLFEHVVCFAD